MSSFSYGTVVVIMVVGLFILMIWIRWFIAFRGSREHFPNTPDDLHRSDSLGVVIDGKRQLEVNAGGLRFTPQGSETNQSLLQNYFQTEVNVGTWLVGNVAYPTLLGTRLQIEVIGRLVTLVIPAGTATVFGTSPSKAVNMITSQTPLSVLRPPQTVYAWGFDQTKRTDARNPTLGICIATLESNGVIIVQRYNRSATIGGRNAVMQLSSFVFQFVL